MPMIPSYYLVHNADGTTTLFFGNAPATRR